MTLLGRIILACLIISALQGIVAVLAIAIILLFLWGVFFRTEHTIGLVGICFLLAALQAHPWLTIGAIGILAAVVLNARKKRMAANATPTSPPLLLGHSERSRPEQTEDRNDST